MIINAKITGKQVDPEVYHRRDMLVWRGDPTYIMSRGELVEFANNPHRWKSGYREKNESSDSQEWGSLIDTLLLDAGRFNEKYAIAPATYKAEGKKKGDASVEKPWNRNASACKEWESQQNGKIVIKENEKAEAERAIDLLKDDPIISEVLLCSDKQVMVVAEWHDESTGLNIPLRALLDLAPHKEYSTYSNCIIDLKTCCAAAPSAWNRAVFQHDYHTQGALYLDMYNKATNEKRDTFRHIIQESFPPYEVGKRILSYEFLKLGREKYQNALSLYCQCVKSGDWPTYEEVENNSINGWGIVDPEAWMI